MVTYEKKILNIHNIIKKMNNELNTMNHIDEDLKTKIQSKFRKINQMIIVSLIVDDPSFSDLHIISEMITDVLDDLIKAKVKFLDDFINELII